MKIDFFEQQKYNQRKTFFIILIFVGFLGIIGYFFDYFYLESDFPIATIFALFIGTTNSLFSYYLGDQMVLGSVGARPANPSRFREQQLINVVKEMAIAAGIPGPKVWVMEEASPNAFATGRNEKLASICVTTGLLETMNREELQGVIAHEIGHIKNRDILTMTIVSALVGAVVLLSDWAKRTFFFSERSSKKSRKGSGGAILIIVLILIIVSPILARIMAMAISRAREYMADSASAEFTRNPIALASALEKIQAHYDKVVDRATDGTAHLFISDPKNRSLTSKEGFLSNLFSTHPPIQKRIMILKHMAGVPATKPIF
ncbi:MAG: M48 family metalloprotease [Candidatus Aminicenantia bacterium]